MNANALNVIAPVGAPRVRRAPAVGREEQLARLRMTVARAPSIALVHGETGVGKSHLVRRLAATEGAGRRLLVGRCHQVGRPFPLGPVIEALAGMAGGVPPLPANPLLGALRALLPEWAQHLPPDPGRLADERAQHHRTLRALRGLLQALGPTLCILEDLQWADEETLEFLVFLAAAPPPGLALVLTCRTPRAGPGPGTPDVLWRLASHRTGSMFALTALTIDELGALAAALLGRDAISSRLAERLHAWTGGVPSAVTAVVGELGELGSLGAPRELPIPAVLREPLEAALAGLGENARMIAWAAAVVDRSVGEVQLSAVAGLRARAGTDALLEALAAGVLDESERDVYGFRSALAAHVAYETIGGPHRRRMHERAACALQRGGGRGCLPEIARHLKQAGAPGYARCAELAASEAGAAGEDALAANLLEDVLSSCELSRAARIRMVLALGDAALYSAAAGAAIPILQRALEEEQMPAGVRGEVRFALSRLLGHAGDAAASRAQATRAVSELRRRPALGVRAMINLAQPAWGCDGTADDHLVWLDRAIRTAARETDRVAHIAVASQRAAILLSLGDARGWPAVRDIPAAHEGPAETLQLSRGYRSLADACVGLGHLGRADAFLRKAELLHDEASNRSWGLWLEATQISLDWCRGRWDGLQARLERQRAQAGVTAGLVAGSEFVLGGLLLARGELDEADRILTSLLESVRRRHDFWQIVVVSGRLARVRLAQQDPQAALGVLGEALSAVRDRRIWVPGRTIVPEAVEAHLACGDPASAQRLVREFSAGLRRRDAPAARAALASCRGALAEADELPGDGARLFRRADAGWDIVPNPYEAARARERAARCEAGCDRDAAEALLRGALRTFDALGANADARRVRAQLKASGAWRGGRVGYGEGLSPREAEVARLAAGGMTNRDIAEALCISPRTVEIHVAASLRKLRLRSRHELGDPRRARQRYVDHV